MELERTDDYRGNVIPFARAAESARLGDRSYGVGLSVFRINELMPFECSVSGFWSEPIAKSTIIDYFTGPKYKSLKIGQLPGETFTLLKEIKRTELWINRVRSGFLKAGLSEIEIFEYKVVVRIGMYFRRSNPLIPNF